jgi:hypothetical protein
VRRHGGDEGDAPVLADEGKSRLGCGEVRIDLPLSLASNSPHSSKDNAAWYLFDRAQPWAMPVFVGNGCGPPTDPATAIGIG